MNDKDLEKWRRSCLSKTKFVPRLHAEKVAVTKSKKFG